MKKKNVDNYRRYWMRIILSIENIPMSKIAQKYYIAQTTVCAICKDFEKRGFLTSYMKGRIKKHELTEKGKEMRQAAEIIIRNTGGMKNKDELYHRIEL